MNEETLTTTSPVPIKVDRVFDSCNDKDCISDLQVVLETGELPPQYNVVKTRCCSIDNICMNVEPIPFNRGYFSVDLTYTFGVELLCYERACDCPTILRGYATAVKSVILYGGEASTKTFFSNGAKIGDTNGCCEVVNLPIASCQCVDPITLETKIVTVCQNNDENGGCCRRRTVVLTLGVFSVIELTRPVTLSVNASPYTFPTKSCSAESDSPCDIFSRISFPTEQFLTQGAVAQNPQRSSTAPNACGCCGNVATTTCGITNNTNLTSPQSMCDTYDGCGSAEDGTSAS